MCKGFICLPWCVPCQLTKCCNGLMGSRTRPLPSGSDVHFRPYGDDTKAIEQMVETYQHLTNGTHFKPRSRSFGSWIVYYLRYIPFILYLMLFFPVIPLLFVVLLVFWIMQQSVLSVHGLCLFYCPSGGCNKWLDRCCHPDPRSKNNGDELESLRTIEPALEECRRFYLYIFPIFVFNVGCRIYWGVCRYLAGFFEANLVDDELIIIWMHLWGTNKNHLVYEYNEQSLVHFMEFN